MERAPIVDMVAYLWATLLLTHSLLHIRFGRARAAHSAWRAPRRPVDGRRLRARCKRRAATGAARHPPIRHARGGQWSYSLPNTHRRAREWALMGPSPQLWRLPKCARAWRSGTDGSRGVSRTSRARDGPTRSVGWCAGKREVWSYYSSKNKKSGTSTLIHYGTSTPRTRARAHPPHTPT